MQLNQWRKRNNQLSYFSMDKNKTRGEDYDSGSLCFLVFTWPNSFQIAVPLILLDQRFLLTFSSCLLTPASLQRSAVLIGTHLVFPQRKITLGVLKLFLDSLDRFFFIIIFLCSALASWNRKQARK